MMTLTDKLPGKKIQKIEKKNYQRKIGKIRKIF